MRKDIFVIFILVCVALLPVIITPTKNIAIEEKESKEIEKIITYKYGIPVDSFFVSSGRVKKNETISALLAGYNVPDSIIHQVPILSGSIFNFRKIKVGNHYTIFSPQKDRQVLSYFIYESSPTEYIIINFRDSLFVEKKEKEIATVRKESSGIISSSLWNTITDNNLHPTLAIELSDIYAWSIDFFGLSKGDAFKVVYEEQFADNLSLGVSNIYAASFIHEGKEYLAFQFEQDSVLSYFDEKGNSLKKAFLKAPLRYSRISSRYSNSRFHPILKIYRPHKGVDYSAPAGTPVYSIGDGVVAARGYTNSAGNYVKIKHNSIYSSGYNHFCRFANGISVGKRINQGDIIGYVGQTGYATGPHLDFRIWKYGDLINPLKVEAPPVDPVKKENLADFANVKNEYFLQLSKIEIPGKEKKMLTASMLKGK